MLFSSLLPSRYADRSVAFGLQILASIAIMGYKVATDVAKTTELRARSVERDSESGGPLERAVVPSDRDLDGMGTDADGNPTYTGGGHEITVGYYILGTIVADWEKVSAAVVVILGMQRPDIVHVGYVSTDMYE